MNQQDLQQISDLMDKKFEDNNKSLMGEMGREMDKKFEDNNKSLEALMDKKFEDNNKKIFKKIEDGNDEILRTMKEEFDENTLAHEEFKKELAKRPSKEEVFSWSDKKLDKMDLDISKIKYLHIGEWKGLPPQREVSRALFENEID
jgi:hypothetical protein